jgi:solute carrier family 25, member 38
MYMSTVTQLRSVLATTPYFASLQLAQPSQSRSSVLPQLTPTGNLISGAVSRVAVGFLLNPFTVLKARYEVCNDLLDLNSTLLLSLGQSSMYGYQSLSGALVEIAKSGPRELFRGFLPSAIRDAPYAGLFIVFYEGIKKNLCKSMMKNEMMTMIHL